MELDHIAGEANSQLVGPLCASHHAIKSYQAENDPIASLRLREPDRSALLLQAAFEFGVAAVLAMMAAVDGTESGARAGFLAVIAAALTAWAVWNIAADSHFTSILGPGYDQAIPAQVPR